MKFIHLCVLLFTFSCLSLTAHPSDARPFAYDIDKKNSTVAFTYQFQGDRVTGSFPDFSADLNLDFDNPNGSNISVLLKTKSAKGGFVFATNIMRGPEILDVARFPNIRFTSTKLQANGKKAKISGNITVKGVTRPIILTAQLFRQPGTNEGQHDKLIIKISGQINRTDFGIVGYPSYVGDILEIAVTAEINKRR
jgi:polyisoprenoid-binding protein YceI